jgi:hypothetical protein
MRYLYTANATQGYRGVKSPTYYEFKAVQTLAGWIGVLEVPDELASDLIARNSCIKEVDEVFYNEILKKKHLSQNPNNQTIQVSLDSTKPIHAHYKEKEVAESVEVEVEEIEVREVDPAPTKKKGKK